MTKDELITLTTREIMSLADKFESEDYSDAVDEAERETGWTCPVTSAFQIRWLKERTKRALYWAIATQSAKKFQYEQIHLEQPFSHYLKLIEYMDLAFEKAMEENIDELVDACQMFGTQINAGFQYDRLGRDTTYSKDNKVIIEPSEDDNED